MPGIDTRGSQPVRRTSPSHSPILGTSVSSSSVMQRHSNSPPRAFSWSRPASARTLDPSRTLPPLNFSLSRPSTSRSDFPSQHSAPATNPPHRFRSDSPDELFAHRLPEPIIGQQQLPSANTAFPPPFTLQPQPQWDSAHFSSVPPPSSGSSWSRPGSRSTHDRSSPLSQEGPSSVDSTQRQGRYDPVRSTYVLYSTPSPEASND
jgi:hypothetical protein